MEVIQPTPTEIGKKQTLEEIRENLIDSWGENEYYQELERQVKGNHSDAFEFMRKYPTYTLGYSVISKLYKLEETILNLKYIVCDYCWTKEFKESRSVEDLWSGCSLPIQTTKSEE